VNRTGRHPAHASAVFGQTQS